MTSRRRNNDYETMYHVWTYSFYPARDARVNSCCMSVLLWLCRIVLALLFIDDILYKRCSGSILDSKTKDVFFAPVVRGCNVRNCVLCSMIAIHWAEKYVMKERRTRWEDRVWLYWVTLFFSWFDLCHVDVEWTVSIDVRSQSFDVWLWSMKENAFWSFSWALNFSRRWMNDLTSSKEGELKPSQYISVIDESLLLRAL